jgi:GNAT superfamily N-acetyltransferase
VANTISELPREDAAGFAQVVAIYREAIEPSEQKPMAELAANLRDARYEFLVSRSDGGIDAFASLFFPASSTFFLLEYMAVDRRVRSRGNGERMFRAAMALGRTRAPGQACVIEVDQPGGEVKFGNDPGRRITFYRRMGCRVIAGLDYILPLDAMGTPPPMMLLVHGMESETAISSRRVRDWLAVMYCDVYRCALDDPRIETMTSRLSGRLALSAV